MEDKFSRAICEGHLYSFSTRHSLFGRTEKKMMPNKQVVYFIATFDKLEIHIEGMSNSFSK
jgi:hypothetical protein